MFSVQLTSGSFLSSTYSLNWQKTYCYAVKWRHCGAIFICLTIHSQLWKYAILTRIARDRKCNTSFQYKLGETSTFRKRQIHCKKNLLIKFIVFKQQANNKIQFQRKYLELSSLFWRCWQKSLWCKKHKLTVYNTTTTLLTLIIANMCDVWLSNHQWR